MHAARPLRPAPFPLGTALALAAAAAPAQRYVVDELPSGSPYGALAWDLNDAGSAVGDNLTATLQRHALVWPASGPGVDLTPGNALAKAQGISRGGVVAGWLQNAGTTRAATWTNGTATLLASLPGHVGSLAQGVTDAGLVCGWSVHPVGDAFAVVWQNGQVTAIGGAHSWAFAASESADVVGRRNVGTSIEAFRWRGGVTIALPDLGPDHAQAVGASPGGLIAGAAEAPNGLLHAVVWDQAGTLHDLGLYVSPAGPLSTQATDVADDGTAVGAALVDPIAEIWTAVVWRGNGPEQLDALLPPNTGWTLFQAQAVNARGEIVGFGERAGMPGVRAFRLRPDCDGDGVADLDEIALGTAHDANGNGRDDACEHCQPSLGFAGPGAVALTLCGDPLTAAGNAATLALAGAPAAAPVLLVVGLANQPAPLLGGTLLPGDPRFVAGGLVAANDGTLALPVVASGSFPLTLYAQAVVIAGAQAQLSNALQVTLGL
jgi:uncharacterized membrane protein